MHLVILAHPGVIHPAFAVAVETGQAFTDLFPLRLPFAFLILLLLMCACVRLHGSKLKNCARCARATQTANCNRRKRPRNILVA